MRQELADLYEGRSPRAQRFIWGLFLFDLTTLAYIVGTSFLERRPVLEVIDVLIGIAIAVELGARLIVSRERSREFRRPSTWADILVVLSFLAPITGQGAGFLRVLRMLRLYGMVVRMQRTNRIFLRNQDMILTTTNLVIFLFVMSAIVYETQHRRTPDIGNYVDALYFTVTAVTTTGFGDIILPGTSGRLLSVLVMFAGVTLFLQFARALVRPRKVRFPCPVCGLQHHDPDAVHCKACGTHINLPVEGAW